MEDDDKAWHLGWTVVAYIIGALLGMTLLKVMR